MGLQSMLLKCCWDALYNLLIRIISWCYSRKIGCFWILRHECSGVYLTQAIAAASHHVKFHCFCYLFLLMLRLTFFQRLQYLFKMQGPELAKIFSWHSIRIVPLLLIMLEYIGLKEWFMLKHFPTFLLFIYYSIVFFFDIW